MLISNSNISRASILSLSPPSLSHSLLHRLFLSFSFSVLFFRHFSHTPRSLSSTLSRLQLLLPKGFRFRRGLNLYLDVFKKNSHIPELGTDIVLSLCILKLAFCRPLEIKPCIR